jgi:hypothetical protein
MDCVCRHVISGMRRDDLRLQHCGDVTRGMGRSGGLVGSCENMSPCVCVCVCLWMDVSVVVCLCVWGSVWAYGCGRRFIVWQCLYV